MWLGSPLQILWSVHNDLQMCCEMRRVTLNCTHDSIMAGPRASNPLSLVDFVQPAHHACPLPKTLPLIWLEQSKKNTNTQIHKYTNTNTQIRIHCYRSSNTAPCPCLHCRRGFSYPGYYIFLREVSTFEMIESEIKMTGNRDREVKVKWKSFEIEIEKWNFSRIFENLKRTDFDLSERVHLEVISFLYVIC